MNKSEFVSFVLEHRDVKKSTATQHYYVMQRFRTVCKTHPSTEIPSDPNWVTVELFKKLGGLSNTTQKNMYSSILVYLKALGADQTIIDSCTCQLDRTATIQENAYLSQSMSLKQKVNWVDHSYVLQFFSETQKTIRAQHILKREKLTWQARRLMQQYLMQAVHGGLIPPPRLEWSAMRYFENKRDALKATGNTCFAKPRAGINIIQGKVPKGVLLLPKPMALLLRRYCKFIAEGASLFVRKNGTSHTPNSYGKELQHFFYERFAKNIGASMLRNIYITKQYARLPALKTMRETAGQMMHSLDTALLYYKKNDAPLENGCVTPILQ